MVFFRIIILLLLIIKFKFPLKIYYALDFIVTQQVRLVYTRFLRCFLLQTWVKKNLIIQILHSKTKIALYLLLIILCQTHRRDYCLPQVIEGLCSQEWHCSYRFCGRTVNVWLMFGLENFKKQSGFALTPVNTELKTIICKYRWENDLADEDSDIKWKYLEHNGVLFSPFYEPHHIKVLYKKEPIALTLR